MSIPRRILIEDQHRDGTVDVHDLELSDEGRSDGETSYSRTPQQREVTHTDDGSVQVPNLIRTNDRILFDYDENEKEYLGTIEISNTTNEHVIFKIKTTAANVYRVRPTIGLLGGGTHATVHVYSSEDIDVDKHRFLVMAAVLPHDIDQASSSGEEVEKKDGHILNYPRMNSLWKEYIEQRVPIQSVRLRCAVNSSENKATVATTVDLGASCITTNDGILRKVLGDLEHKVSGMLEMNLKKVMRCLWILMGLVAFFGIVIFASMPSTVTRPTNMTYPIPPTSPPPDPCPTPTPCPKPLERYLSC